mgnify:CR=1 FL=1
MSYATLSPLHINKDTHAHLSELIACRDFVHLSSLLSLCIAVASGTAATASTASATYTVRGGGGMITNTR